MFVIIHSHAPYTSNETKSQKGARLSEGALLTSTELKTSVVSTAVTLLLVFRPVWAVQVVNTEMLFAFCMRVTNYGSGHREQT